MAKRRTSVTGSRVGVSSEDEDGDGDGDDEDEDKNGRVSRDLSAKTITDKVRGPARLNRRHVDEAATQVAHGPQVWVSNATPYHPVPRHVHSIDLPSLVRLCAGTHVDITPGPLDRRRARGVVG